MEQEKAEQKKAPSSINTLNTRITNLGAKARLLEDRYEILRKKIEVVEDNLISLEKEYREGLKLIEEDIIDIKKAIEEIKEKVMNIAQDINNAATVKDYREIKHI
ncbi:hypothetical protein J7K74_03435 [Candidatus Woesearchaeota archaeon]|nr:hypothetical protein [Candidatus Woesearchaeota archaeon]